MTTYPISAPPVTAASVKLTLNYHQTAHRSPYSGHTSITDNFADWNLELGFAPATKADANKLMAWIDSLRGSIGTFLYSPPGEGTAIGGVTLNGTGFAYSEVINVSGLGSPPDLVGQLISIQNRLYRVTSYTSTSLGIAPALRVDIPTGTAVNFSSPTGTFRLAGGDTAPGLSRDIDARYPDGITAVEAL